MNKAAREIKRHYTNSHFCSNLTSFENVADSDKVFASNLGVSSVVGSCSAGFKATDKGTDISDINGGSTGNGRCARFGLPLTRSTDGAQEIFGICA